MKRMVAVIFAVSLLAGCATAPRHVARVPQSWATRIDALLAQPRFAHAEWGVSVMSLDSGRTLYAHNPDKLFVPASNAKLYTAALALDTFGPGRRFDTTLYRTDVPIADGTLNGNLILAGGGDPSLGRADTSPDWADRLAQALASRGVHRIRGDLVADATFLQAPPFGNGWEANDLQAWYAAPASALNVQGNLAYVQVSRVAGHCCAVSITPDEAGLRVVNLMHDDNGERDTLNLYRPPGSESVYASGGLPASASTRTLPVSVPDPARFAGNLLRDALLRQGIALEGQVRALYWPQPDNVAAGLVTIDSVNSPPLSDLVTHMLKTSDNLYAQTLLQEVGVRAAQTGTCLDRAEPPTTSDEWGLCALRAMLARAGIADDSTTMEEGAGLSRKDLVTPAATTRLLAWIARQSFASGFRDALPIAGVDGTLEHRFLGTPAADNLRAKTGTLTHAYALSGYVTDAAGEHLAFALMLDHYQRPSDSLGRNIAPSPNADLDTVAAMLTEIR